ncbi:hypothetical protein FPV67DRAFT_1779290 [Lyophyllum atratum]|nr:hypothetical protein FPV67DRAFT_1779290 [Lyophyllum atratum]
MTITLRTPSAHVLEHGVSAIEPVGKDAAQAVVRKRAERAVYSRLRLLNQATPVGSIPPEILVQIFEFADRSSAAQERRPWSHAIRRKAIPITVSHVSGHWRDVALSSPVLWTEINISPPWSLKTIRRFLSRSAACPIHLNLTIPTIGFGHLLSSGLLNDNAQSLRDIILEHIPRCRKITIKGDFGQLEPLLYTMLNTIYASKVPPPLEHLNVQVTNVPNFPGDVYHPFLPRGAPLLTQLRVTSLMVPCLPPLERVTSLHLALGGTNGIDVDVFTATIASCPLLETLAVYDDAIVGPWPLTGEIELPSLRSLQIYGTFASVSDLLRVASAPLLEDLVIAPIVGDDLLPFYHQTLASGPKFSTVKSITLSPVFTSGFSILINASWCFPAVERLTIPNIHPDSFRDIFEGPDALEIWPNLKAIASRNIDTERMRTLISVIEFRKALCRPLEALYFDYASIQRVASMVPLLPQGIQVVEHDVWSMLHDEDLLHEPSHFVGNDFDFIRQI